MKTYPMINFMVRYGRPFAILAAVVVFAGGFAKYWRATEPLWLGIGIVGGIGAWVLLRSLAELIEVVADTLMPR
jgi:hypothetical protein